MKTKIAIICLVTLSFLAGCKGNSPTPVSELIKKVWTVQVARENSTVVYTKGGSNNVKPTYSRFILDLSSAQGTSVRLTEIDGTSFGGTYTLSSDNKRLTLNGLSPAPTGSNGTIEFTITGEVSATSLKLVRTTPNPKTGNTNNEYDLVNP